jgi:hypothetical protein
MAVQTVKWDPISSIPRTKISRGMVQVADHLLSNCEALSSNSSTTRKENENKKRITFSLFSWKQLLVYLTCSHTILPITCTLHFEQTS